MEIAIPRTCTVHSRKWGIYNLYQHTKPFYTSVHSHPLIQSRQEFASDFLITAFCCANDTSPVSSSSSHSTPFPPSTCGDSVFFHG